MLHAQATQMYLMAPCLFRSQAFVLLISMPAAIDTRRILVAISILQLSRVDLICNTTLRYPTAKLGRIEWQNGQGGLGFDHRIAKSVGPLTHVASQGTWRLYPSLSLDSPVRIHNSGSNPEKS